MELNYKEAIFGAIPAHWEMGSISDCTEIVTDYVANGSFASLKENVKYLSSPDYAVLIRLVDHNNGFNGNFVFIDEHSYNFLRKSKLIGGEIIISNVGANVGTVFKCPELPYKMSLAPNSIMVKFKGVNDFYYYWLKSDAGQFMLKSIVSGSAQPKFNKTDFRRLIVPMPPIDEQHAISNIMSALDHKISLNTKINHHLEQIAQAIYKSWFVDFEPWGGVMPNNWNLRRLGEFFPVITGKMNANISSDKGKYPFFSCSQNIAWTNQYSFDGKAVLVAGNGDFNVKWYDGKFEAYQRTYVLMPYDGHLLAFLYYATQDGLERITSAARGSVIRFITKGNIENHEIAVPDNLADLSVIQILQDLNEQIAYNIKESSSLAALRDTLLPRLMSGKLL